MTGDERPYVWRPREAAVEEREPEAPVEFLSRWARRKSEVARGEPVTEPAASPVADQDALVTRDAEADGPGGPAGEQPAPRVDPRTGKLFDELTDEDMPSLESLDTSSDLSVFLARNISPGLRMQALAKIFHDPKYNVICTCAEYAEDYTNFTPLGDVIPHDLKASITREADKLRKRLLGRGEELTQEEAEARIIQETSGERAQDFPTDEELLLAASAGPGDGPRDGGTAEKLESAVQTEGSRVAVDGETVTRA